MARRESSRDNTNLIRRALATAQKEIDRAERNFHQTIRTIQKSAPTSAYRSSGMTSRVSGPAASGGKPAPVQTAITKVLSKRRRGLTMERLQEALPQFDEKSLLNATYVMRQKGFVEFDRSGIGRGVYRWQDCATDHQWAREGDHSGPLFPFRRCAALRLGT
jgi:hypothetical protein